MAILILNWRLMPPWKGGVHTVMVWRGGRWLAREMVENKHINCLELEAAELGLQALCDKEKDVHIH